MNNHLFWAIETMKKQGCNITVSLELIQKAPWSEVTRLSTPNGHFYLKKTPSALFLEVDVIQLLRKNFSISVPTVIAENRQENCFLMYDAGISLRTFFKEGFHQATLIKVLEDYSQFQSVTASHLSDFFHLAVPDWRLNKLPSLYQTLVEQEALLKQFRLTNEEIQQCQDLVPTFQKICETLAQYNIPDTFGHCDFHDNNVLIHPITHQTTMIDLGEVVITHPFFSIQNILTHIKANCGLTEEQYTELQEHAFQPWLKQESLTNLKYVMAYIQQYWLIHAILGIHRLMETVDPIDFENVASQNHFAKKLRSWLSVLVEKNQRKNGI